MALKAPKLEKIQSMVREVRQFETSGGGDPEPFQLPLFSNHPLKKHLALPKILMFTCSFETHPGHKAPDFGAGFDVILTAPSGTHRNIFATYVFDSQLHVATELRGYFHLRNDKLRISKSWSNLVSFKDGQFDTVVPGGVLDLPQHSQAALTHIYLMSLPQVCLDESVPNKYFFNASLFEVRSCTICLEDTSIPIPWAGMQLDLFVNPFSFPGPSEFLDLSRGDCREDGKSIIDFTLR